MTSSDRDRMNNLCERIAVEKDPLKYQKLACELNDLVSTTLKLFSQDPSTAHIQQGSLRTSRPAQYGVPCIESRRSGSGA
jgi:hypothetical protein